MTNGIEIGSSYVEQKPISKKVMLERTGEMFDMIVNCTIQTQLSKSLLIIHNKEIGLLFSVCCIESFICTGVTLFFFQFRGDASSSKGEINPPQKLGAICLPHSCRRHAGMLVK